jgi:DNA-directed RNA polymerase sigma subunit (sigma70/sigma32)
MASVVLKNGPDRDFSRYLRAFDKFPMLSAEDEFGLVRGPRDHRDVNAAYGLVTAHLRLVAKIAAGCRGYGRRSSELIGKSNIGTTPAVARFDPDRGFRLAAQAMRWIRAASGHGLNRPAAAGRDGECRGLLADETERQEKTTAEREALTGREARSPSAAQPVSCSTDARES